MGVGGFEPPANGLRVLFEGIGKMAALLNFFNFSISYLILGATSLSLKIP